MAPDSVAAGHGRTPFLIGRASVKQKSIMETVISTAKAVSESVKDGAGIEDVTNIYESGIKAKGFKVKHSLGHGIGLETHEGPSIFAESKGSFKSNMVFTIEPGVYQKGTGGCRIENDFIVKKNGCESITKSKLIKI